VYNYKCKEDKESFKRPKEGVTMKIYVENSRFDKSRYSTVTIFGDEVKGHIVKIRREYVRCPAGETYNTVYIFQEGIIQKIENIVH
jgi:hypothetical protein